MKFTRFGTKLFYMFLMVSLIPLTIAGAIVYKYVHDTTKEEVLEGLRFNAYSLKRQLDLLLSKRMFRVADFCSDGFIRDSVEQIIYKPEISQIIEKLNIHLKVNKKSLDPDILEIEILNHKGKVIAATSQEQLGKDKSHTDYFRNPFLSQEQKGPYFADSLDYSEDNGKLELVFSSILTDKNFHNPLGVLVTKVKGEILQDMLKINEQNSATKDFSEHFGKVYVVNRKQEVIAGSVNNDNFRYGDIIDSTKVLETLETKREFSGLCKNSSGNKVLCTTLFIPETNWVILTEKDLKKALMPLTKITHIFIMSGGAALVLVCIFAFAVSSNINSIIRTLLDGIKRIASGDLKHTISVIRRKDEIGELSESFVSMSKKLRISHEALEEYNQALEQKVEARTLSLRQANKKLQATSQAKSDFVSIVSHELRTPLTSVLGFARIVKKKFEKAIYPNLQNNDNKTQKSINQIRSYLETIESEGDRLTHLIDDLLDITKIESGELEWKMESVSLSNVFQRAKNMTKSLLEKYDLRLIEDIESGLPEVVGDKYRLEQLVINLVSNAAKFTEKGSITYRASSIKNEIVVSIIDTGIGIAEANLDRIFERFKQSGDTLKDRPKGTGLGLPICKEIVEGHGGRIWVESKQGEGSNFSFALPISCGCGSLLCTGSSGKV
jgi:signal transduction histidine kinase